MVCHFRSIQTILDEISGEVFSSWGSSHTFLPETTILSARNMGGRSDSTSECKSVTNSGRNSLSQEDKGSELKGRKQAGRSATGDKKNENAEPSKLTYTSDEDIYYEPGGERKENIKEICRMSNRRSTSRRYGLFVLLG